MRKFVTFLVLLALVAFSAAGAAYQDKPTLTADEIINKHLEATGGKEALAKIQSRIAIGTVKKDNDPESRMAILSESPNRLSAVFVFAKFDWQLTYDGSKPFMRPLMPRDYSAIQAKYQELLSSGLMFNSISLYNTLLNKDDSGARFEAKGLKKVRGNQAYVVEMKRPKAATARLYFDANTFMWTRTEFGKVNISKPMGTFTNENIPRAEDDLNMDFYVETSDFKDVNGLKLPFKFDLAVSFPITAQKRVGVLTGTISEYRHNEKIDPKMFQ